MRKQAVGIIETVGLTTAITTADAMIKAANVQLIGYEITNGLGLVAIKVVGDVGAVKAALDTGTGVATAMGHFHGRLLIARPGDGIEMITQSTQTKAAPLTVEPDMDNEKATVLPPEMPSEMPVLTLVTKQEPAAHEAPEQIANTEMTTFETIEASEVCNLCHDPQCTRKKGEPRSMCLQQQNEKK